MTDRPTLWVVSPLLHDVESYKLLHVAILRVSADQALDARYRLRFVVIDDSAGEDATVQSLESLEQVKVVAPPYNLGHQRALVFGLRQLSAELGEHDLIVTMDSDGQDLAEDVPRLVAAMEEASSSPYAVVLARRTQRPESLEFKLLYRAFKVMFRILTGTLIRSGNFACLRAAFVQRLLEHPYFNLCFSSTFKALRVPVSEVPCARGARIAGHSRMNTPALIAHGFSMLMPFIDVIATRLLILFSLVFGATMLLSAVVVLVKLATPWAIPGWATYTLLLLLAISFMSVSNFVILFALFSQAKGFHLRSIGKWTEDR